jgi:beta-ribofuranosylaminobenzene 5'-phosphate synthase
MIEVRTSARLHLGLLDNNGGLGRLYGSVGLAVESPRLVLRAEASDRLKVVGPERQRITTYARRFIKYFGFPKGAHLNLAEAIPAHVGLGSGTQLGLAVGSALARLSGRDLDARDIAVAVERGAHSGIGISTFRYGGFVLDGGHRVVQEINGPPAGGLKKGLSRTVEKGRTPPVLFHRSVPGDWFFVLAIPDTGKGLNGKQEDNAFLALPRAPARLVEKISRVLLVQMLPALVEKDIVHFGQALTRIQCMVGDCFASVQGGRFANPVSEKMVDFMLKQGAAGIGQSSWGPTVYSLVKGKRNAETLAREAKAYLDALGGGRVFPVRPQNRGAQIIQPAPSRRP